MQSSLLRNVPVCAALILFLASAGSVMGQQYVPAAQCACAAGSQQVAYYAPQTVYAPQTAYRTVWRPVQVTTYRPLVAVDPWTGVLTTYFRPEVTMQWQAQQEATTAYRPILTGSTPSFGAPNVGGNPYGPPTYRSQRDDEVQGLLGQVAVLRGEVMDMQDEVYRIRQQVMKPPLSTK